VWNSGNTTASRPYSARSHRGTWRCATTVCRVVGWSAARRRASKRRGLLTAARRQRPAWRPAACRTRRLLCRQHLHFRIIQRPLLFRRGHCWRPGASSQCAFRPLHDKSRAQRRSSHAGLCLGMTLKNRSMQILLLQRRRRCRNPADRAVLPMCWCVNRSLLT
jgi:hypothetical protein